MRKFWLTVWIAVLVFGCLAWTLGAEGVKANSSEESPAPAEVTEAQGGSASSDLSQRWGEILGPGVVIPAETSTRALRDRQPESGVQQFGEQFFFRASFDYVRNWASFTGEPTLTDIVDNGPPFTFTPEGFISFPQLFEEQDEKFYGRFTFGTRGWGSDRLSTYVSMLSYHDLDGLQNGSPFQSPLDNFGGGRNSVLNAYFQLDGIGSGDGFLSRTNLRIGRQYIHSYSNALYPLGAGAFDGGAVDYRDERFNVGGFIGSRAGIYSDPEERLITGFNFGAKLGPRARFDYDMVYYAQHVLQNFAIEPLFEGNFRLQGFFRMVEDQPVDIGIRTGYSAAKWSINASLIDRLTDDDFIYDIFYNSGARNSENQVRRLYLGLTEPSFRASVDASRSLTDWLVVGGRLWFFQLHDDEEQGPFESSFQDYSGNIAILPADRWEIAGEYRFRDLDREEPGGETEFADIEHAGETEYQEFTGSVGYRYNRFRAQVGTYYRLFDLQNRIFLIDDSKTNGVFANLWVRLTRNFDFRVIYNGDNDYAVFNPDIDRQHGLRIGIDFHR